MGKEKKSYDSNILVDILIRYKPRMMKIADGVLQSQVQSEDIFQDAVVKACALRRDCIQCPVGYACRMVYNLALDAARKGSREKLNRASFDGIDMIPAPCASALDCLVAGETLREVLRSLKDLPQRTHDAFVRHRIEGIPQKEIAAELGVSPTLVNFMIKDARQACERTFNAA